MDGSEPLELIVEMVGDMGVVRLRGEVDHATGPQLRACAESLFGDGARSLVLDMAQVTFLDSSGLKAIVQSHHQAHELGGTVTVRHAPSMVRRVMEVTGLGPFLVPGPDDRDDSAR